MNFSRQTLEQGLQPERKVPGANMETGSSQRQGLCHVFYVGSLCACLQGYALYTEQNGDADISLPAPG